MEPVKTEHTRDTCDPPCDEMKGCMACNLFCCGVCGGAEGSLPSECPGTKMSNETSELVFKSTLDFKDGHWMRRPYQPWETPTSLNEEVVVETEAYWLNERRKENPWSG